MNFIKPESLRGLFTVLPRCWFSVCGSMTKAKSASRSFNTNHQTSDPILMPSSRASTNIFQMTDLQFGQHLAGLIETDGYIGLRNIEIAFDLGDDRLAETICMRFFLNPAERLYDQRRLTKPKNAWSLFFTQSQVANVLNLVNNHFVGPYKVDQKPGLKQAAESAITATIGLCIQ